MAIEIYQGSVERDAETLLRLARAHLDVTSPEARFQWLYRNNPFGPARCWIAFESATKQATGMAAAFPRRMFYRGAEVPAYVLGDFCLNEKYRTLGPALQLQRACLEPLKTGEFSVAYDFPSSGMVSIYRRLNLGPSTIAVRLAKPISFNRKLEKALLSWKPMAHVLCLFLNLALALKDLSLRPPRDMEFRLEHPPCLEEYSELAQRVGPSLGTCTVRTAEYLNWRYFGHPYRKYEMLSVRRAGQLLGYCIFTVSESTSTIVDLFGSRDDGSITALVAQAVRLLRKRGVALVSTTLIGACVRPDALRRLGFWARESFPVVVLGPQCSSLGRDIWLTHGDREG